MTSKKDNEEKKLNDDFQKLRDYLIADIMRMREVLGLSIQEDYANILLDSSIENLIEIHKSSVHVINYGMFNDTNRKKKRQR